MLTVKSQPANTLHSPLKQALKSSFPGVRKGGMKGGDLDVCLSHGQAARPGSEQPGQGESQAQQAAGQESL